MVVDYRTHVLKISEEDELDTKLTRIPSAKKYKDIIQQPSEEEIIKLAPPPKKAWARRRKRRKVGPSSDYSFSILQGRGKSSPPPSTHLLTRS